MKMDLLNPLISSCVANTVNGGPDISLLRAEREVVRLLVIFVSFQSPLAVFQISEHNKLYFPFSGDPQSLF